MLLIIRCISLFKCKEDLKMLTFSHCLFLVQWCLLGCEKNLIIRRNVQAICRSHPNSAQHSGSIYTSHIAKGYWIAFYMCTFPPSCSIRKRRALNPLDRKPRGPTKTIDRSSVNLTSTYHIYTIRRPAIYLYPNTREARSFSFCASVLYVSRRVQREYGRHSRCK